MKMLFLRWPDLGHDLKADPLQTLCHFGGMDAGVPDVADGEGGHEFERFGPVDSGVARHGRVAGTLPAHVRLLGWSESVVHAVAPGTIEAHPIRGIGSEEPRCGAIEESGHGVGVSGVAAG